MNSSSMRFSQLLYFFLEINCFHILSLSSGHIGKWLLALLILLAKQGMNRIFILLINLYHFIPSCVILIYSLVPVIYIYFCNFFLIKCFCYKKENIRNSSYIKTIQFICTISSQCRLFSITVVKK